ncbi:MAG: type II and III secretion system protein family protein [Phenylobacterium sp.]|jgi:pilus assembly protein CpaC|uniref:type II and III secretion system protein family protein n=1 Tax=Phenylobacterium sp. TaxID=1871053 RepID=UPI002A35C7F2|nr:type II and III secretion system protein family protein [Phenylobacterium sp.]MDX9997243.1 type II and III secretion system protein family protein [Phenylobacterium sp.]
MSRILSISLAAVLALTGAAPQALADAFPAESARSRTITVPVDKSLSFRLDAPASKIVVAQPETAQIVATTDQNFYVRGKKLGSTNLLIYSRRGDLMEVVDVRVGYDAEALQQDLAAALPGEKIVVRNLGNGLLLTGQVSNTAAAVKAKALAEKIAPESVTSALTVDASQQVILEVRILEASRTALNELGFDIAAANNSTFAFLSHGAISGRPANLSTPAGVLRLSSTVGTASFDVTITALEEKGVVRTLARPNLAALSGEKASFLAGGEFPFPVPAGDEQVTIEFRPFGVTLDFEPVVQDNGLVKLKVAPEVSAIDPRNSLRTNGFDVPSLSVRRAATTVELRSGESFAIAGLFQQDYLNSMREVPGLGDVPVLGALFRSTRWRRNETELVIIVTPRLATAADLGPQQPNPLGAFDEPSAIDLILMGATAASAPPLGPVGREP